MSFMGEPSISWDMIARAFSAIAAICCTIGAWWCKGISEDVKKLERAQATAEGGKEPKEQLQTERWTSLQSRMTLLEQNVQALVHCNLKKPLE